MCKKILITQIKSSINLSNKYRLILICLGLRYIGHIVLRLYTREICGMLNKVFFLVKISWELCV